MFSKIRAIIKGSKSKKISPTITQPRQLKKTMKKMRSKYERFAFKDAKTAKDRANIVRTKKSIERMDKLNKAKDKRKEGIKASKEIKKMVGTGQADRVGGSVYHRGIREKKAEGGKVGKTSKQEMFDIVDKFSKDKKSAQKIKNKLTDTKPMSKSEIMDEVKRQGLRKGGRTLKPVDKKKNPGLAKLPTQVRNKMGYMKDGGKVKKFGGGKK